MNHIILQVIVMHLGNLTVSNEFLFAGQPGTIIGDTSPPDDDIIAPPPPGWSHLHHDIIVAYC